MCYLIITSGSLVWFLLSLVADMLVISALVTPKWLIGPAPHSFALPRIILDTITEKQNEITVSSTSLRYPSVGIYTRCKAMKNVGFHCGPFDLDGFRTDSEIYPTVWKATMFFVSLGFTLLTLTVACTLISCCRQSICGKSIHNMTACAQVIAGEYINLLFIIDFCINAVSLRNKCNAGFIFAFVWLVIATCSTSMWS